MKKLPRLVILDLDLGYTNGDGLHMCREIRTNTSYQDIPILILSTDTDTLFEYKNLYKVRTLDKRFGLTMITGKIRSMLSAGDVSLSRRSNSLC